VSQESLQSEKRILVVDDTTMSRLGTVFLLHELGYTTEEAESGKDALQKLKGQNFDCVLMDFQMPQMNGIECTEQIRASNDGIDPKVPIVALTTGTGEIDLEARCILAGMNGFVLKSASATELAGLLKRLIK
jgi:CheY-like chemotaxis protein